jgi:hypothetical protein
MAVLGALYVPVVTGSESWELLTAVPLGLMAFLMLLGLETDGVAVLLHGCGAAAEGSGGEGRRETVAAAFAAGALAVAFLAADLEPFALALAIIFLPLVILEAVDVTFAPRFSVGRGGRALALVLAWVVAALAGSWFYPGLFGLWRGALAGAADFLGLPFPLTETVPVFGAVIPTLAVAALVHWGLLAVFRQRARGEA